MSAYLDKAKGWRYDFQFKGKRFSAAGFKTKTEARRAEARRREEVEEQLALLQEAQETGMLPQMQSQAMPQTPLVTQATSQTGMDFLELANRRLDHVQAYNSARHYAELRYMARRWVAVWGDLSITRITPEMLQDFVLERVKVSPHVANKEIRYLRALFNFAVKWKWLRENPANELTFFPVEKRLKRVPTPDDIDKVIAAADQDTQDYLWTLRETLARVSEVNRLTWDDIDLEGRFVVLYTRKKKGGHLTPRKVPMPQRLFDILSRRHASRDQSKPWVFWHEYTSSKTGERKAGPYQDRKKFMKTLCEKAGVEYFRFHALRHSGASVLDSLNVPIGSIQRILGHENRTTTEIYLHGIGDGERQAMEVFEQARGGKVPHSVPHQEERGQRHSL